MRQFVQSLRRLYLAGRVSLDKIKSFVADGTITTAEYGYIIAEGAAE